MLCSPLPSCQLKSLKGGHMDWLLLIELWKTPEGSVRGLHASLHLSSHRSGFSFQRQTAPLFMQRGENCFLWLFPRIIWTVSIFCISDIFFSKYINTPKVGINIFFHYQQFLKLILHISLNSYILHYSMSNQWGTALVFTQASGALGRWSCELRWDFFPTREVWHLNTPDLYGWWIVA